MTSCHTDTVAFRLDNGGVLRSKRVTVDGAVRFDAVLTRTGVFTYSDGVKTWREYRAPEEVFAAESLASFELVPVTDDHPPEFVSRDNATAYRKGRTAEGSIRREGNDMIGALTVEDAKLIVKIDEGKQQVSNGYECVVVWGEGASPEGERYDARQTTIRGNHVAIVDLGRAGNAKLKTDAKTMRTDSAIQIADAAPSYSIGDRVVARAEHMNEMNGMSGVVAIAREGTPPYYGIEFDDQKMMPGVHKWLAEDEIEIESMRKESAHKAKMPAMAMNDSASGMVPGVNNTNTPSAAQRKDDVMNLEQALAALAAANKENGAYAVKLAASEKRGDDAEHRAKDTETRATKAEAERDSAKTRADAADEKVKAADVAIAKAKTDAAAAVGDQVKARVDLLTKAAAVGVKEIKRGDATIAILDAEPNEIRLAVIAKIDGAEVTTDKRDNAAYVEARFDFAIEAFKKSGKAFDQLNAIVNALVKTTDTADKPTAPNEPNAREAEARKKLITDSANAYKNPEVK